MNKPKDIKPASIKDPRAYFRAELLTVIQKQNVETHPLAVDYLANLMSNYMQSHNFFARDADGNLCDNVLAELYAKYVAGDRAAQQAALKRLGDICLLVAGFFSDSLRRKSVDVDYYTGMGGSAYWHLANIHFERLLFQELATKFANFVSVFEEFSERSGITTNTDILRIYEKWLLTGNDRLRNLLWEHGIGAPIVADLDTKQ